jgi:hypothetical protein
VSLTLSQCGRSSSIISGVRPYLDTISAAQFVNLRDSSETRDGTQPLRQDLVGVLGVEDEVFLERVSR